MGIPRSVCVFPSNKIINKISVNENKNNIVC